MTMMPEAPREVGDVHALIVGAGSGIGAAIADRLESRGAVVARADLRSDDVGGISIDVTDPTGVAFAVAEADRRLDGMNAVVNCAGILGSVVGIEESTLAEFENVLRVNLVGMYLVARETLPLMRRRGYGRFVQIASIAGKEGNAQMGAYSASKAGAIALVKVLAKEYAETGVTVNAIAPGTIDTPLIGALSEERREIQRRLIPLGRLGTPDEAAALATFVVSPENSFTTGFVYDLSGGRASY